MRKVNMLDVTGSVLAVPESVLDWIHAMSIRQGVKPRRTNASENLEKSKSVQKALRILVCMGRNGADCGVTELATALHLDKATVHRLLNALRNFDLVEKIEKQNRYRLGLKLFELGNRALESRTLRGEARPFLEELSREMNETAILAIYSVGSIICLDRVDPRHSTTLIGRMHIGARFAPHCTAIGKVFLGYLPEDDAAKVLAKCDFASYTPSTITSPADLKAQLRRIRKRGYSTQNQEAERGLSAVAAPVLGEQGVIAAISLSGPTERFRRRELSEKIAATKACAARMSAAFRHLHLRP